MSGIQWTDRTWNPVRGCSRVSEGCRNCYAERIAARFSDPGQRTVCVEPGTKITPDGAFVGFAENTPSGPRWTGKVALVPEKLDEPLRWKKPARVFVNSMSDLFHEKLADEDIDKVFAVMALAQGRGHTFQILTKRPKRMREYLSARGVVARWTAITTKHPLRPSHHGGMEAEWFPRFAGHIWLGVSVEDQATADERIPLLLKTPAAVRFVSYEPALGPVDFTKLGAIAGGWLNALDGKWRIVGQGPILTQRITVRIDTPALPCLDWIIYGGESGPGARSNDIAWARSTVEACKAARVACFVKQLGTFVRDRNDAGFEGIEPWEWPLDELGRDPDWIEDLDTGYQGAPVRVHLAHRKGGAMEEWPADLRVREFPR